MPKLTEDSLEKRFSCQYCGESFRTRQGLSGHIQFKHSKGKKVTYSDIDDVISKIQVLELGGKAAGLSPADNPVPSILKLWPLVLIGLDMVNVKCTDQDFKNYMLVSLAQREENERLRKQLVNDFKDLLAENR